MLNPLVAVVEPVEETEKRVVVVPLAVVEEMLKAFGSTSVPVRFTASLEFTVDVPSPIAPEKVEVPARLPCMVVVAVPPTQTLV